MYADKIIKMINKTVDSLEYKARENDLPFKKPEKALIVLPNFIGDVVLLTPFLRNLRHNLGDKVVIDAVCNKNIQNLIETLPYIDDIHISDNISQDKVNFLKNNDYDTVFLFNMPFLWALASYKAKIKQRVSFNLERIGLYFPPIWQNLITHFMKSTPFDDRKPQWKVYLETLNDLGLESVDENIEIRLTNDDIYRAKALLQNINTPRISIHVTAGSPGKHWNLNNWITVLEYLRDNYNYNFIAVGTAEDKDIYDYLSDLTGIEFLNLCGKTTIRETIALYQYLDTVITLDTSSAHLAAMANTKNIIIIYGPTNEAQWTPQAPNSNVQRVCLDMSCRPCLTRLCYHKDCLNKLTPDRVIEAINKVQL